MPLLYFDYMILKMIYIITKLLIHVLQIFDLYLQFLFEDSVITIMSKSYL